MREIGKWEKLWNMKVSVSILSELLWVMLKNKQTPKHNKQKKQQTKLNEFEIRRKINITWFFYDTEKRWLKFETFSH